MKIGNKLKKFCETHSVKTLQKANTNQVNQVNYLGMLDKNREDINKVTWVSFPLQKNTKTKEVLTSVKMCDLQ